MRFEQLELRELLTAQAPLITDATPYSAAFVNGVYQDVLGRPADVGALNWFTELLDQGQSTEIVPTALVNSNEYAANLVQAAYQQYLGRDADPGAMKYWISALHAGVRDEQLAAALVGSDEFYARAGGNDADWIAAAYHAVLGRAADPSGLAWAGQQLAAGASRDAIANGLTGGIEHEEQIVEAEFSHYLHLTLDGASASSWATQLSAGQTTIETIVVGMLGTNSYYEAQTGVPPSIVPVPTTSSATIARNQQIEANAAQSNASVVFLGDSVTQMWQTNGSAVWAQDYAPLNAYNEGVGGDGTQNILWRIENGDLNGLNPKVVVLMAGINDFPTFDTPQEVADGVTAIVEELRVRLPDTKILVLGILPAVIAGAEGNFMPVISETNQLIAGLADEQHVFFLNMWPAFTYADGSFNPTLHISDGLHLNQQGYAVWAQTMAPELDYLLNSP
ncbi:MAG TPA: GDSL-type esterase/lipase family protein [Pirellulales bacterium]|nr:GDSL-type esterase/lipase family protein [Pirellulales bacterium]